MTTQEGHHDMQDLDILELLNSPSTTTLEPIGEAAPAQYMHDYGMNHVMGHDHHDYALPAVPGPAAPSPQMAHPAAALDPVTELHELKAFAERFKERRTKLGVSQANVGKALANMPGVSRLSQASISRFENLTISQNNMIALKPILQAWLEEAEAQANNKRRDPNAPSVLPASKMTRKRTFIAPIEKRSLEAYFAVQPRPSGQKITAIAKDLKLKKNVVSIWFCNQRQIQKRIKSLLYPAYGY